MRPLQRKIWQHLTLLHMHSFQPSNLTFGNPSWRCTGKDPKRYMFKAILAVLFIKAKVWRNPMSVDRGLLRSPQKSHNKGAWAGGSLLAILDALQDPLLSEQSKVKKNVHNRHHLCKKGVNVTVCLLVFSKGNNGRTKWKIKKSIVYAGKKSRRGGQWGCPKYILPYSSDFRTNYCLQFKAKLRNK